MLRQHGREVSVEHHVLADSDSKACGNGEPEGLVVTVANSDREAATFESSFQVQNSKHLHAITRHRVLVFEDTEVSEAERFDQRLNNSVVRNWLMRSRCVWRGDQCQ